MKLNKTLLDEIKFSSSSSIAFWDSRDCFFTQFCFAINFFIIFLTLYSHHGPRLSVRDNKVFSNGRILIFSH